MPSRHTQGQHSRRLRRSKTRQAGAVATSRRQCNDRVVTRLSRNPQAFLEIHELYQERQEIEPLGGATVFHGPKTSGSK